MNKQEDHQLRELFERMRDEEREAAPEYRTLRSRPRPLRSAGRPMSRYLIVAAAMVGLFAVIAATKLNRPDPVDSAAAITERDPQVEIARRPLPPTPAAVAAPVVEENPSPTPTPAPEPLPQPVESGSLAADDGPMIVAMSEEPAMVEFLVASSETVSLDRTQTSTTFGDEFIQDLPVQGRFYTNVLTLAPRAQDSDGDGNPNVFGSRERHFAATVGGVSGSGSPDLEALPERESESGTESYSAVDDNPFHVTADEPLSTFSADVDTASYSNVRRYLRQGQRPPRDAVRIEELINYFDYEHPAPVGNDPFGVAIEVADCPWQPEHRLARITLAARRELRAEYAGSNLVFLIDVSGSMQMPNKLDLLKQALGLLAEQLDARDTVSIVVYAGSSGLALPPTAGSDTAAIRGALQGLEAGGSTAGAEGLRLAYRTARGNFIPGGVNRVILATDGDFNVGVNSQSELLDIIREDAKRGIYLTALGFGMGNYKDDRLEHLADHGNGNYAYIDTLREARKVLVEEIAGTLVMVAKDVKFQVEFNPQQVASYRLIGYTNRLLAHRDFNDDTKDAGDVGAGHTVTVLYELQPAAADGGKNDVEREVDSLRYQGPARPSKAADSGELFALKVRFKLPDASTSKLRTYPVFDTAQTLGTASDDFRFATSVAVFGMRLRNDPEFDDARITWKQVRRLAREALGEDVYGHRRDFIELLDSAVAAE